MAFPDYDAGQRLTAAALNAREWKEVSPSADQSVANSTAVINSGIVIPVKAGELYEWRAQIVYSAEGGGVGTGRFRWAWSVPTGMSLRRLTRSYGKNVAADASQDAGGDVLMRGPGTTTEVAAGSTDAAGANGQFHCAIDEGYTLAAASVDGNMILTFAQLAADATATILRDDSICYWRRKS